MRFNRLLDLAVQIQQIPAPPFGEARRAEFVRRQFLADGLEDVAMDSLGDVYGRLRGEGRAPPLVITAHLDTVFPAETDLRLSRSPQRIQGPGIGDNSIGVAALLGLSWLLRERRVALPGDVWLVADVGEEGLGDLRGMRAVVDRFDARVTAYLILEGLALGHVYHRAVGVQRYRLTARTAGGHPWCDNGQPSAVHELAALVTQLTAIPLPAGLPALPKDTATVWPARPGSVSKPDQPRTILNVGRMAGGMSVNAIAAEAWLEVDLRSESAPALDGLVRQVEEIIRAANRPGVSVEAEVIGRRPAGEMPADHPLARLAEDCLRAQGLSPCLIAGSTDANLPLSRGYPALCLGVTSGGGAHTMHEYIDVEPVAKGMEQLICFVSRAWETC